MQLKSVPLDESEGTDEAPEVQDEHEAPEAEDAFFSTPPSAAAASEAFGQEAEDEEDDYVPRVTMHNGARYGVVSAVGLGVIVAVIAIVANRAQSPSAGAASGPKLPDMAAYRSGEPVEEAAIEAPPPAKEPVAEAPAPAPEKAAAAGVGVDGKIPPLPEVDPKASKDHIKQAFALFNAGKFAAAEREAVKATRSHPTRADAWLVLGAARDALGDHSGAISAYRTCGVRARGPAARDCHRLALAQAQ